MSERNNRALLLVLTAAISACAWPAVAIDGTAARTLRSGGLMRSYLLHVPAGLPAAPAPLVLVFHGGGGTPAEVERETRFSELADRERFLVAYPEGIGHGWNDGRGAATIEAQRREIDDVGFVAALLDDVERGHRVDADRVYSTGLSNGAFFSHTLAIRMAQRFAAIAPVAGGIAAPLGRSFTPAAPVSVLILQGTADPLVPYAGGEIKPPWSDSRGAVLPTDETVRRWVEHDGCARSPREERLPDRDPDDGCRATRLTFGGCRDGTSVVLYRLDGGGHTWPGSAPRLPRRVVGGICRDVDATDVIWQFFRDSPRSRGR
jgi:polyhydroxybutyrate depolymerase